MLVEVQVAYYISVEGAIGILPKVSFWKCAALETTQSLEIKKLGYQCYYRVLMEEKTTPQVRCLL